MSLHCWLLISHSLRHYVLTLLYPLFPLLLTAGASTARGQACTTPSKRPPMESRSNWQHYPPHTGLTRYLLHKLILSPTSPYKLATTKNKRATVHYSKYMVVLILVTFLTRILDVCSLTSALHPYTCMISCARSSIF